jgi:phage terminase large subunit-like protein
VINSLSRIVPGIVPEEPHGSKVARASAVPRSSRPGTCSSRRRRCARGSPTLIEEAAAFPNGAHDDQVDAMSQALNRLILAPLREDETRTEPEEFEEYDARGYAISPL